MTLEMAIYLTSKFLFFCFLTQSLEIYILSRQKSFQKIWSYPNLSPDLELGLPFGKLFIKFLFSNNTLIKMSEIQIVLAALGLMFPHWVFLVPLLVLQLLVGIRFRGTFNGGSDMMTFVVATGTLVSLVSSNEKGKTLGLLYIAVHTLYSYFKSGLSKLTSADWRSGQALPGFLKRSVFADIQKFASTFESPIFLSGTLCWGVILFELSSVSLIFYPESVLYFFAIVLIFHSLIFYFFGLNRFLWIWLSAWPATYFSLSLLNSK